MAETSDTERIRILMEFEAEQAEKNAKRMERAVESLERRYDPLARATQRYDSAQKTLNRALDTGKITADRHAAAMAKVEKEYQDVQRAAGQATQIIAANGAAVNNLTGFVGRNRAGFQQLGYQVGDFAVQVQGGTSAVTAFTQQGSQLLGVFGPLGAILGAALAVFVPLGAAIFATGEKSNKTKKEVDAFKVALDALTASTDNLRSITALSVSDMQEKYGQLTASIVNMIAAQQQFTLGEVQRDAGGLVKQVGEQAVEGAARVRELQAVIAEMAPLVPDGGAFTTYGQALAEARHELEQIEAASGLAGSQIIALDDAMKAFAVAEGPRAQAVAIDDIRAALEGSSLAASDFMGKLLDAQSALYEAANAADDLGEASARAADLAATIANSAPGAGWMNEAIAGVSGLISALGRAIGLKNALGGPVVDGASNADEAAKFKLAGAYQLYAQTRQAAPDIAPAAPKSRGGRGKGGGGGGGANDLLRERDRILEGLKSKEDKHNEDLAKAESLYKSGALTLDQYHQQVSKLEEAYNKTQMDQLEKGVKQIADTFADAIVNGEDLGEAFGNLLRKMAADLLSSGIQKLIQNALFPSAPAGRSGIGGVFGSLLGGLFGRSGVRSFDGGGYTGSGARVGGLDGKGGMPALIHPRETVIDHTRGPSLAQMAAQARSAQGDGVRVSVEASPYFDVRVQQQAGQIAGGLDRGIVKQTGRNFGAMQRTAQARY